MDKDIRTEAKDNNGINGSSNYNDEMVSSGSSNSATRVVASHWGISLRERILAILMLPIAYIYFQSMAVYNGRKPYLLIFVVLYIAFVEAMNWQKKRTWESFLFLGLTILSAVVYLTGIGTVWNIEDVSGFMHLFAVYWTLVRSGCLTEGQTSHMFIWDGISALLFIPFGNFVLIFKTIVSIFVGGERKNRKRILITLASVLAGLILFAVAMTFLSKADDNFARVWSVFSFELNSDIFFKVFFSLHIAMFLYGLVGGSYRNRDAIVQRGQTLGRAIERLNKVPVGVWIGFIGLFTIFYLIYFIIQGSYLFSAFGMILPEQFTYSEYARQGFGEMCKVMIVNFILLWLTLRTSEVKSRLTRLFSTVLLGESFIFALIAFMKLFMYISAYGFTPLRIKSLWLIIMLSFACVCILISMFTRKKTARVWVVAGAISLGALMLI